MSATANTAKAPQPSPPEPARAWRIPDYDRRLAATPPPSTRVSTPLGLLHGTTGRPATPTAVIKAAIVVEDAVREWAASGRGSAMLTQGAKRAHRRSMCALEQLVIAADESTLVARAEARKARGEMRALDKRQAAREQASAQSTPTERT